MKNNNICRICGTIFSQKCKGRKREYCNDNCRDYYKFLSALDKVISNINFSDLDHVKTIKGDLFALANTLPKKIKQKDEDGKR